MTRYVVQNGKYVGMKINITRYMNIVLFVTGRNVSCTVFDIGNE